MNTTTELLYKDLQDEREYVKTQAAYIEKGPKREAFINKMNYKIDLRKKILLELAQKEKELEEMRLQLVAMDDRQDYIEETTKSETAEIREILLLKGKEAARAESISRAMRKWSNLY